MFDLLVKIFDFVRFLCGSYSDVVCVVFTKQTCDTVNGADESIAHNHESIRMLAIIFNANDLFRHSSDINITRFARKHFLKCFHS